jgi:glycosyltransferase involved in cell wall biosynthesis
MSALDLDLTQDTGRIEKTGHLPHPDDAPPVELTVVMPCLNEEKTVGTCVAKAVRTMHQLGIVGEVLVVDNGSTDKSVEVARAAGARVVKHDLKGYGNALRRGFAEAQGTFVIMGDADDSYDFTDLGRFVDGLRAGADVVMGNRLAGEVKPGAMPWLHRWVGNPGLTFALNLMFQTGVGDTHCGMRGFRKDALRKMNLQMPGMELASELVIKGRLANLKVTEIPITLYPDGRDRRPHLRSFRDGWRHLRFMLMCAPWFLFVMPGALLLAVGLLAIPVALAAGYGVWDHYFGPNFLFGASVAALTGFHLIVFGILAKVHANLVDPVFRDPRMDKLARVFRVERGALYGGALLVLSALLGLPVLWTWFTTSTVTAPGQWIFAGTLFMLGVETVFLSFLIGIMDLSRESRRQG